MTQTQILDLIARLPLIERRELVAKVHEAGLLEEGFYERMTPEQRAELEHGIAEAERGDVVDADAAMRRIASKLQLMRS